MVLLAEILLLVGIVVGVVRLATRADEGMATVEPDRVPGPREDVPLTADDLVAYRLPAGVGYRKIDVDRLLDRLARQLPRAGEPVETEAESPPLTPSRVSLTKEEAGMREDRRG